MELKGVRLLPRFGQHSPRFSDAVLATIDAVRTRSRVCDVDLNDDIQQQ